MYAIKAIYDGTNFKLSEPAPVQEEYEVVITFTVPLKETVKNQKNIMKYFGTWDKADMETMAEIIKERADFSLNRPEV